jgi:hypothetical protein
MRHLAACLLLALTVSFVSAAGASARPATAAATGVIAPVGNAANTYSLTITNHGDQALSCLKFFVASGVTVTGITGSTGLQITFAAVGLIGNFIPVLQPNGTAVATFTTSAPYPTDAGGLLRVSVDCVNDVTSNATGPSAAPPVTTTTTTTTTAPSCVCAKVAMTTTPHSFTESAGHTFEFTINYQLTCTGGGGSCKGGIKPDAIVWNGGGNAVTDFVASDLTLAIKKDATGDYLPLSCYGHCPGTTKGVIHIVGHSRTDLTLAERRGATYKFKFELGCSPPTYTGQATMVVAFDSRGFVDRAKSDLNADGRLGN